MKFHDRRDHFMTARGTSFKSICFHKNRFEICQKISMQLGIFEFFKQVGLIFQGEFGNVFKN